MLLMASRAHCLDLGMLVGTRSLGGGRMAVLAQKKLWRFVPLVAATIIVGVGAYFVGLSTISDMQRSHAEYAAKSFARHLFNEIPDLAALIEGRRSPQATAAVIGAVKPIGTV